MSGAKLELAFKLGVEAAENKRLEETSVLLDRFYEEAKGDCELMDDMFDRYMEGIEWGAATYCKPKGVRHEAC